MNLIRSSALLVVSIVALSGGSAFAQDCTALTQCTHVENFSTVTTGEAIRAINHSTQDYAIYGQSISNVGAYFGGSNGGVFGSSASGYGVYGSSSSSRGVYGDSFNGTGVYGSSKTSIGVDGDSNSSDGVFGNSVSSNGIHGQSSSGNGIYGTTVSSTASAIIGINTNGGYGTVGITGGAGSAIYGRNQDSGYAGFFQGNVNVTGSATKPGGGSWAASSDSRVKKDVASFGDGLTSLLKVRPVTFKYNGLGGTSDDGKQFVGVIAQELEKVVPSMVTTKKTKLAADDSAPIDLKQVDPSAFTYMLINAVKEQNKVIVEQGARIERLESLKTSNASFIGVGLGLLMLPVGIGLSKRARKDGPQA